MSYLDLPDLDSLSRISTSLGDLTKDPLLHKCRILIVAPSRVKHSLFGHGGALRPTIPDLVHWGVLRGLGIERRWRMGTYFNSREVRDPVYYLIKKCLLIISLIHLFPVLVRKTVRNFPSITIVACAPRSLYTSTKQVAYSTSTCATGF